MAARGVHNMQPEQREALAQVKRRILLLEAALLELDRDLLHMCDV